MRGESSFCKVEEENQERKDRKEKATCLTTGKAHHRGIRIASMENALGAPTAQPRITRQGREAVIQLGRLNARGGHYGSTGYLCCH